MLPQTVLAGLPVVWYGGVHCDPSQTATLRRVLYEHYPTVTVIDVAATLEVIRQVMLQVIYVIQFLAAFSIFAGIVILASAIAGTRYRRIREVVVLKTLGATRPRIASIFSIEFAVLGLIAGAVGLIFANVLARTLLLHAMHFGYGFQPWVNLAAWVAVGAMTVLAGWLASHRVLGRSRWRFCARSSEGMPALETPELQVRLTTKTVLSSIRSSSPLARNTSSCCSANSISASQMSRAGSC